MLDVASPTGPSRADQLGDPIGATSVGEKISRSGRRLWRLPLGAHVVGLVFLLLLLVPLAKPWAPFQSDEGAVGVQVEALRLGGWHWDPPLARLDPHERWYPLVFSDTVGHRSYPYLKHPAYPAVLADVGRFVGIDAAFLFLGLGGVVLAACSAWRIAELYDPRAARFAFWLVALSPLLVDAYILWAHAPATGAAGIALLGALRLQRRGWSIIDVACAAGGLAVAIVLRSEGLLLAGAVLAVTGVVVLRRRGVRAAVLTTAPIAAAALFAWKSEQWWIHRIAGRGRQGSLTVRDGATAPQSYVGGRLAGAWHSLLDPGHGFSGLALLGMIAGAAWLLTRRRVDPRRAAIVLGSIGLLVVLRLAAAPTAAGAGLLVAWPVAVIGIASLRRREVRRLAAPLTIVGLYAVGVLATQYPDGGGTQHAGRFLRLATVPLATFAAIGLARLLDPLRPSELHRRPVLRTLSLVMLAPTIAGLLALATTRRDLAHGSTEVAHRASAVNVTTMEHLPRQAWRLHLPWLYAAPAALPELLAELAHDRVHEVTLFAGTAPPAIPGWTVIGSATLDSGPLVLRLVR